MLHKTSIRLGVNIDHIATLRQVRGGTTEYPNLISVMKQTIKAGADQITIHLREDRRHIQDQDVVNVCKECSVDVNLEMACSDEMVRIALKNKPDWVCLVPEKRAELTTEGGLNLFSVRKQLEKVFDKLQSKGIEISLFIEPDLKQVELAYQLGADAIEFHTGKWVLLKDPNKKNKEFARLIEAAEACHDFGMRVHAGHGLDHQHTLLIKKMPFLQEVNIGHSLICYSLETGIFAATKKFKNILK